jgi:hypothetical protein
MFWLDAFSLDGFQQSTVANQRKADATGKES